MKVVLLVEDLEPGSAGKSFKTEANGRDWRSNPLAHHEILFSFGHNRNYHLLWFTNSMSSKSGLQIIIYITAISRLILHRTTK